MFGSFGFMELILVLVIVMIVFGAGKLPQLGEGIGKAIKGFKKSVHEADAIEVEAQPVTQSTPSAHPTDGEKIPSSGQVAPENSAPLPNQGVYTTKQ